MLMLFLTLQAATAGGVACVNTTINQDLNCNTIDVRDEAAVNISDPTCQENVDDYTGLPYSNADYYYDYHSFGCDYFVDPATYDIDGDGLSDGQLPVPPDAKFPGDDSPVVWGQCGHAFHLQCITRWLNSQAEQRCPICRGAWEFKQLTTSEEPPPLRDQGR